MTPHEIDRIKRASENAKAASDSEIKQLQAAREEIERLNRVIQLRDDLVHDKMKRMEELEDEKRLLRSSLNSSASQIYHLQEDNSCYLTRINELQEEISLLRENQMPLAKKGHELEEEVKKLHMEIMGYLEQAMMSYIMQYQYQQGNSVAAEALDRLIERSEQTTTSHQQGPADE